MSNKLHLIENDNFTDSADTLDFIFCRRVKFIFEDYIKQGYPIREIEYVLNTAIRKLALENLLKRENSNNEK